MTLLDAILSIGGIMPPAAGVAPPVVKIGPVTGAQIRALGAVAEHLAAHTAGVADAETVADTIIAGALTAAGPMVAALAAPAAEALANALIEAIAAGKIKGGSGANDDPLGRGGRRD